ncbi:MAG: D-aminoacyl-tRNA deacylase [Promethearchaeota archaeon]
MNIREKFLNSNIFNFEETGFTWHENRVYKLNNNLIENDVFLGLTKDSLILLNDLKLEDSELNPDLLIFASRHRSKTARPAFLVHSTGNWGREADFGGEPKTLSNTSALLHKAGFISLIEQELPPRLNGFSIDIEVTHHGPTILDVPLTFMELGSSRVEWNIREAGVILTKAIINTIQKYIEYKEGGNQMVGLGFGGTHYAPNFHRLIKNNNLAMSFMCPKYFIQDLNSDMIKQMINNTLEEVDYFIIDWKGTNSDDKRQLIPLLEEFEVPIKKTKDFK